MFEKNQNIKVIKTALKIILFISCIAEIIFFLELSNIVGCVVSIMSLYLYDKFVLHIEIIKQRPLSFVAITYLFLFMYLPLPVTLLDGNSMSHDMHNPILTYILQFCYFGLTVFSFEWAKHIRGNKNSRLSRIFRNIGYFNPPSVLQLWILALIGWIPEIHLLLNQYTEEGSIMAQGTLSMLAILIYAPICILFPSLLGSREHSKSSKLMVLFYIVLLIIIGIATNHRGSMLSPLIVAGWGYFFTLLYRKKPIRIFSVKKILLVIIAFLLISGPASDMAFAMLITRNERNNLSFTELLKETVDLYLNKNELDQYRKIMDLTQNNNADYSELSDDWDETYVSNIFLQRVCNYRVVDASIYHAGRVGLGNKKMLEDFFSHIVCMLPQPILDILGLNLNKKDFEYSPMDYLYYLSTKAHSINSSYIVGGDVGLGLATFGILYFFILVIIYRCEFYVLDSQTFNINNGKIIPFFVIISVPMLRFAVASGIQGHITYLFYSFPLSLTILLLVYNIVRFITPHTKVSIISTTK